ncbi:hypothetical protein EYF80_043835 [Liparis tanakae]|uniref:Uncharacterized protein n=1 Tax=Liparis tanakae TaxID=230148 RepID=A0A4Z2FZH4_9TELE|nr:hypothetical protein EYF80_043835 [Liparis tanakae]
MRLNEARSSVPRGAGCNRATTETLRVSAVSSEGHAASPEDEPTMTMMKKKLSAKSTARSSSELPVFVFSELN